MSQHFKIPVLTDELLSQIMWGMENQDSVYMLNIKDCSIYSAEDDSVSPEFLVNLPPWQSSDGYQLMVSFTNACKDSSLKTKLAKQLETKGKGVFRRFRDALSEANALEQWYQFKEQKMKSKIKAWYRDNFGTSTNENLSDGDEPLELGNLLSDFEICHLDSLDDYCNDKLNQYQKANPILDKCLSSFTNKKAYEIKKDSKVCGTLIYETVQNQACILYYYIEKESRELGLFSLMFDFFNREMERQEIESVLLPLQAETAFLRSYLSEHEALMPDNLGTAMYSVKKWNSNTGSAEFAYLL